MKGRKQTLLEARRPRLGKERYLKFWEDVDDRVPDQHRFSRHRADLTIKMMMTILRMTMMMMMRMMRMTMMTVVMKHKKAFFLATSSSSPPPLL
jgi:hypothetical protein